MKIELLTPLHISTPRQYSARMNDEKAQCMEVAMAFDRDYWDGERKYGYGGYRYDGRWKSVAVALIDRYRLGPGSSVLDVGCGKAHLLAELSSLLPGMRIVGLDRSRYALENAPDRVRSFLIEHDLRTGELPFRDGEFDLVLSLNVLHNLHVPELFSALREIARVGKSGFISVESYRTPQELINLQSWALTCASFYDQRDWEWIFQSNNYRGDYEFIYFS